MLQTGVPNLDLILGGGVPEGDVLLVVGPPGSGKTTLAFQMAFHTAARGENALYVSSLSEPPTRLMGHLRSYSFFDERLIGKRLFLLSIYPLVKQSLEKVADALVAAVREHEAALVIVDGVMTIRDLHPEAPELRSFIYELGAALPALDTTVLLTTSAGGPAMSQFPEFTMADGILELGVQHLGTQTIRTIRSSKMRGLAPRLGQHSLRIDGRGLTAFPRIESVFEPRDAGISQNRVSLGLPELDAMAFGGLVAGSSTVLAGALGTGKTLACLHYIYDGAQRGEKGLLVGFRESPRQLMDKARAFGMDLETPLKEGRVAILHYPPVDLIIDKVTWELRLEVERFAPQRLALDGIASLERAIGDESRKPGYMAALVGLLRGKDITSLVTKEIAQAVGPELDFSDMPLAVLAENLFLLRYVEFRGELYRIVSILKMRDNAHDHSIRQYTISEKGLRVLARTESAEGVLTGIARLPSEMRVKRRTSES